MNTELLAAIIAVASLVAVIAVGAMTMNDSDGNDLPGMTMPGGASMPMSGMTTTV
jgi:hypothetical protein